MKEAITDQSLVTDQVKALPSSEDRSEEPEESDENYDS